MNKTDIKKNYRFVLSMLALIVVFASCESELDKPINYPRVEMKEEIQQDGSGVTFSAEVLTEGNSEIIDKGFMWRKNYAPLPSKSAEISLGSHEGTGEYTGKAQADLIAGKTYYVKAFVKTSENFVLSNSVKFTSSYTCPPPEISDFTPKQAGHNEEVIITGDNFSFFNDNISVHFGQTAAIVNSECTNNSISVTVPDLTVDSAKIQVEIYDKSVTSTEYFYYNGR